MSTSFAMVMYARDIPTASALEAALADRGVALKLAPDFRLDAPTSAMTAAELDGRRTAFEYAVGALTPDEPHYATLQQHGDRVLIFEARDADSVTAALQVQSALSARFGAWGWTEEVLTPPEQNAAECAEAAQSHSEDMKALRARLDALQQDPAYQAQLRAHAQAIEAARAPSSAWGRLWAKRGPDIFGWVVAALVFAGLVIWRPAL
ncbi:MAG: hypothetical protein NW203_14630 [Hyphomonadaceae bacterium]|nr:hypothetical protein [Hyphomonadaceae bacterium]